MPKSHVILASLLIAASAAAPSGVYIPSATSSNSVQNQNTNTQPQSQSRFKSIRAESPSEKPVVFGRPDKWGRYRTYDGKIRKSHKKVCLPLIMLSFHMPTSLVAENSLLGRPAVGWYEPIKRAQ